MAEDKVQQVMLGDHVGRGIVLYNHDLVLTARGQRAKDVHQRGVLGHDHAAAAALRRRVVNVGRCPDLHVGDEDRIQQRRAPP